MLLPLQNRSWNVSFLWLQRRVGAQFLTLSYMITDNMLHYHDGDKWVTRVSAPLGCSGHGAIHVRVSAGMRLRVRGPSRVSAGI